TRFILFLDDVLEKVDLAGVPPPNAQKRSKVVFTTCTEEVCKEMREKTKIKVDKLSLGYVGEDTLKSQLTRGCSQVRCCPLE
ncbi:hypothetical protein HID58_057491, partial [Brassica napus]